MRALGWSIVWVIVLGLAIPAPVPGAEDGSRVWPLIPWPVEVQPAAGEFPLSGQAGFRFSPAGQEVAELFQAELQARTGLSPAGQEAADLPGWMIVFAGASPPKLEKIFPAPRPESYHLQITPEAVILVGSDRPGLLWATRTLLQLLRRQEDQWVVPAVKIRDYPRFPRRSLLLDPARNFISLEGLKRQVNLLSELKLNVLHLHLTDDQGWRFESKAFPKLQEAGGEGKFYTQEQLKELAAYASARGVMIMPEIDMPGHTTAWLAAYPELSCSGQPIKVSHHIGIHPNALCPAKEEVYDFIKVLLGEVAAVFPSEYIHIGSDEVVAKDWDNCPACAKLLAEKHLAGKKGLHSIFVARVNAIITGLGRKTLAWDEVTEFAPGDVAVQVWHRKDWVRVAAEQGRPVISSTNFHTYLDYPRYLLPLRRCYRWDPLPPGLSPTQEKLILGGGGNLWGEFATEPTLDQKLLPRLPALAEVYWSPQTSRDYLDFRRRLDELRPELEARGMKFGK